MRYDFSPLYRSTVGFDRLFDMLDQATRGESANWPPYNIEKSGDDEYRITMAGAGGVQRLLYPCCSLEDVAMRTYDFSPLYRSMVGIDRIADMLDQATRVEPVTNWPPYNIEKAGDDCYRITMAVAGFRPDEIETIQQGNRLVVTGQTNGLDDGKQFLHRGIAKRAFERSFNLADHVKVTNANLANGLLTIELKREVPDTLNPRRIEIGVGVREATGQGGRKQVGGEPNPSRQAA